MKRIATITNGEITNVSLALDDAVLGPDQMLESDAIAQQIPWASRPPSFPEAEKYQVREWMLDNGLDPETVPAILQTYYNQPGQELDLAKALNRWENAIRIPRNHALVNVIGSLLSPPMSPAEIDEAWSGICSR